MDYIFCKLADSRLAVGHLFCKSITDCSADDWDNVYQFLTATLTFICVRLNYTKQNRTVARIRDKARLSDQYFRKR